MRQGLGIHYYFLFKTSAPDGSAFFGLHRSQNPSWGTDGTPINYIGNGLKLQQKAKQFGIHRLTTEVIMAAGTYDEVKIKLDSILTPATLADPLCLNMPQPVINQKISDALTGLSKSEGHKAAISTSMVFNENALGHVKTDETKAQIAEAHKKMKWWHRKDTGEEIQLSIDEEGLTGFELGRLPKEFAKNFKRNNKATMSDADRAKLIRD